jgi:hypothetical protein
VVVGRIPMMVAPRLGGRLIAGLGLATVRVGVAITIGCSRAAALLLAARCRQGPARPHEPIRIAGVWRSFDARLRRLLAADVLARWAEGIPKVFVIIYCARPEPVGRPVQVAIDGTAGQ